MLRLDDIVPQASRAIKAMRRRANTVGSAATRAANLGAAATAVKTAQPPATRHAREPRHRLPAHPDSTRIQLARSACRSGFGTMHSQTPDDWLRLDMFLQ